jgi:hypothetical protein
MPCQLPGPGLGVLPIKGELQVRVLDWLPHCDSLHCENVFNKEIVMENFMENVAARWQNHITRWRYISFLIKATIAVKNAHCNNDEKAMLALCGVQRELENLLAVSVPKIAMEDIIEVKKKVALLESEMAYMKECLDNKPITVELCSEIMNNGGNILTKANELYAETSAIDKFLHGTAFWESSKQNPEFEQ